MSKQRLPELAPVEEVHSNPWFSVRNRGGYFTVETPEVQVAVLVVVDSTSVVLVDVIRPVIRSNTWELPAGGCEPGESLIAGAAREVREETGINVSETQLTHFAEICVCPNRHPIHMQVFRVDIDEKTYNERQLHDSEVIGVKKFSFRSIKKMIVNSEIFVALPVAALAKLVFSS